jgi:hypothetical protein
MADQQEDVQPLLPAAQQNFAAAPVRLQLQQFWPASPDAWFGLAEAQFRLRGVVDERTQFDHVLGSLPEVTVRSIADLLVGPAPADAYTVLKRRLLASHSLTEFHRLEMLLSGQGLGGQKPSELLADMLQLCPPGDRDGRLFRFMFLHRLPRELRIILAEDADTPLHALAVRADILWSHNSGKAVGGGLAAVHEEPQDGAVAAVQGGGRGGSLHGGASPGNSDFRASRGNGGGRSGRDQRGRGARNGGGGGTHHLDAQEERLRLSKGLCVRHFVFGSRAYSCEAPCTWQGN